MCQTLLLKDLGLKIRDHYLGCNFCKYNRTTLQKISKKISFGFVRKKFSRLRFLKIGVFYFSEGNFLSFETRGGDQNHQSWRCADRLPPTLLTPRNWDPFHGPTSECRKSLRNIWSEKSRSRLHCYGVLGRRWSAGLRQSKFLFTLFSLRQKRGTKRIDHTYRTLQTNSRSS